MARLVPPGTRISGSRYVRAYCCKCTDPIRVTQHANYDDLECEKCKHPWPGIHGCGSPHGGRSPSPWRENAVRALEDQ